MSIQITHKHWPGIVALLQKLGQKYSEELSDNEKEIVSAIAKDLPPACNPVCDSFNNRRIPYDFDTRVIAYFSTDEGFSEQDREIIHKAVMNYGKEHGKQLDKLSVHVIKYFRKALLLPFANIETKLVELVKTTKELQNEIQIKNEYSKKLLEELAFLSQSIQTIIRQSTGKVIDDEKEVIQAFEAELPNEEIIALIKQQNRVFVQYLQEESQKASKDSLTGIYNRGSFEMHFENTFKQCQTDGTDCTLMVIDIDCFKQINDTYGHNAGDKALKHITASIEEKIQMSNQFFARYGGEEFVLLLTGVDHKKSKSIAETIRMHVAKKEFQIKSKNISQKITISIGVAQLSPQYKTSKDFFEAADNALYQAKNTGRNKVCTN